jgi:glycosyltransferase involved in cell wall biosynthesis
MQHGMPVISVDTGGVTNIVPGIKIPLQNPEQVVSMLAEAFIKLGQDAEMRDQMGHVCKTSVENHTWEEKARQIYEIYTRIAFAG